MSDGRVSSIAESTRDVLGPMVTVGNGIDHIDAVARHVLADDARDAYEAMHVIASMVDTLRGLFEGKITGADTEAELLVLRQSITEAADPPSLPGAPVDTKFDGEAP